MSVLTSLPRPHPNQKLFKGLRMKKEKTALFEALFTVNSTVQQNGCIVN